MTNNTHQLSTGVCDITLVGLPDGAKDLVIRGGGITAIHPQLQYFDSSKLQLDYVPLPPGKKYTFLCTLKTAREEDAAMLYGKDPATAKLSCDSYTMKLQLLIEKEGLYLKNPYGEKEPKPDMYVDGEGIHCKNSTLIDNWRAAEKRTFHDIAILLTE